jgi:hypothetical protein
MTTLTVTARPLTWISDELKFGDNSARRCNPQPRIEWSEGL